MGNPKVSVVVTSYNKGESVLRAINSILKQTYKNIEIIVIDDFSTDNSADLLEQSTLDFIFLKHLQNKGQNAALKTGFSIATGEYLAYLDSDDWWDPRFIENSIIGMGRNSQHSEVDFVFSFPKGNRSISLLQNPSPSSVKNGYEIALSHLGLGRSGTFLMHRKCLAESELFPVETIYSHTQDNLMGLLLARKWKFRVLDMELLNTNVTANSLTFQYKRTAESLENLMTKFHSDLIENCDSTTLLRHFGYITHKYLLGNSFLAALRIVRGMARHVHEFQDFCVFTRILFLNIGMFVREKVGTAMVIRQIK